MNKTSIEWVKNPNGSQGYTWNPITGCLNGCSYCYARKLANGRLFSRYMSNTNVAPHKLAGVEAAKVLDPFYPRFWEEKLEEPLAKGVSKGKTTTLYGHKRRGVFVCDMSDLFGIGIPEEWTRQVMESITDCPNDRFYLLTKQPQNLAKWSPFPPNCYVGVSATNDFQQIKALAWLQRIEAKVKYLSIEPLLEEIILPSSGLERTLDWLIIGQQTPIHPETTPKLEWIKEIVEAADRAGVKVFLKDNLRPLLTPSWLGNQDKSWAFRHGELRQETP